MSSKTRTRTTRTATTTTTTGSTATLRSVPDLWGAKSLSPALTSSFTRPARTR
jgi:hypothetical protein